MDRSGENHVAIGFQPADDNVLIRLGTEELSLANDAVAWGEVVAVGPGRRTADGMLIAPNVAAGDRVALRPGSAMHLSLGGQSFAIVGGSDVLGVLLQGAATAPSPRPGAADVGVPAQRPQDRPIAAAEAEESLETDVAPDLLDREAPTAEDLH